MTGPISFEFAAMITAIIAVTITSSVAVFRIFQTKADAEESEKRMRDQFDKEISVIRKSVDDVHKHLEAVRVESREQIKGVHGNLEKMRDRNEVISYDVSFIRATLEAKPWARRDAEAG